VYLFLFQRENIAYKTVITITEKYIKKHLSANDT